MMSYLLLTLVAVVLLASEVSGKTVKGLFKSEVAKQQNGQFITKFMYQGIDAANVSLQLTWLAVICFYQYSLRL